MSDDGGDFGSFGSFASCDGDCGGCDVGDCDCDCGNCDCGDCVNCDDCCDCGKCECSDWFKCGTCSCDCCGGDDGCRGNDSANDDDSVEGHARTVQGRGSGLSCCFISKCCDCCQEQPVQSTYELEQRGQVEPEGPNVTSTANGAPDIQEPSADSEVPTSTDQEPNIDNAQTPTVITTQPPPTVITTQPPPYEDVAQRDNI